VPSTYQCSGVGAGPDLSLAMSHSGTFNTGQRVSYDFTVRNGVTAARTTGPITLADTLPTGLTYVSGSGTGWSCGAVGQAVTCTYPGLLQQNGRTDVSLSVAVGQAAIPGVTNSATVSTPGDTNTANNSASDAVSVTCAAPRPNIGVAVTRGAGGQLNVTLTAGLAPIRSVQFDLASAQAVHNVSVDVPPDPSIPSLATGGKMNQTASFGLTVGAPQLSFVVKRLTASGSFTLPLTVTDGCGDWETFVGAGS
jgi:uncharacterized repeat protein (TIGR01451 family)